MDEIEKIKSKLILKRLNSPKELQDWIYNYLDIKFPLGTVYPGSTHSPVEAMWRIYELFATGKSKEVPQVCMLSSRDSYKTLGASAIMVLLMVHFRIQIATAGAIKAQSDKMIQYIAGHFRKIDKYLTENGWQKISESKSRTDWLDENGWLCFVRVVVATVAGMNCVKGNTTISTDRGNLKASKIYSILGDGENIKALSYNHETGTEEYKQITNAEKNKRKKILKITTSAGKIECSPDHKIYIKDRGYIKAKDLIVGDKCFQKKRKLKTNYSDVKRYIEKEGYKLTTAEGEYTNESSKIETTCPNGHVWNVTYQKFKNKNVRCGKCKRISYEDVKRLFEENDYKLLTVKDEYTNTKDKLKSQCPNGHTYNVSYNRFSVDHRCSEGDCNKKRFDTKFVIDFIEKEGYRTSLKQYRNQKQLIEVTCPKNHKSKILFSNFYNHGKRCKHCYRPFSKSHKEIVDYIKHIYGGKVRVNDREKISPFELDVYVPEFNFGIEFDGLYWHSEKIKKNAKKINKAKAKAIKDNNINVLCIYEDEWNSNIKRDLIKNMIASRLCAVSKKLRASKLTLKKLDKNKFFKDFFDKYHLDGQTKASFAYGLYNGEELVSCMSFRKSFSDKCWEIARFASKPNIRIYGNASKFIKKFKEEYCEKLVTYSNNRLSLGNTYSKLGFKEVTQTTEPSYYYTDFKTRLWRFKCRRINEPKVLSKYPTEKAQAEGGVFSERFLGHSRPLYKIYDYGHRKWELQC